MGKTIRVEVTAEDIAKGHPCEAHACPIALAAQRAGVDGASFWPASGRLCYGPASARDRVQLDETCRQFANNFDKKLPVEPFAFTVVLP